MSVLWKVLLLFFLLMPGIDWWQSRSLRKGALPPSLRTAPVVTLDGSQLVPWSQDRYTILYVFSPWCTICKVSANNLNTLLARNLHVVSLVLSWERPDDVQRFVRDTGLQTPVLMGRWDLARELGIETYPSYMLISPRGEIIRAWTGYTSTLGLYVKLAAVKLVKGDISI